MENNYKLLKAFGVSEETVSVMKDQRENTFLGTPDYIKTLNQKSRPVSTLRKIIANKMNRSDSFRESKVSISRGIGGYYLLHQSEYPEWIPSVSEGVDRFVLEDNHNTYYSLEFEKTLESLTEASLQKLSEPVDEPADEPVDEPADEPVDEPADEPTIPAASGAGEERDTEPTEELTEMEITPHKNDMKMWDSLPKITLALDGKNTIFKVGFSNILYLEDKTIYGVILSPIVQGRSVEIYVCDQSKKE